MSQEILTPAVSYIPQSHLDKLFEWRLLSFGTNDLFTLELVSLSIILKPF